ncbi:MAG TPA: Na+/H+ antiporter NhaA [Thermoanaerobaculia bacterium]|nr:Na+/H+ antiporter NhaA [Thermoanaerobaculia bacterium]
MDCYLYGIMSHPPSAADRVAASSGQPLIERVLRPFAKFAHTASSGGIVLLVCTALALAWANSPWAASYHHIWELEIAVDAGPLSLRSTLHHLINDGLMAVFFFLVGLEIKREVLIGELASLRQAALPAAAALGGMAVPAAIYAALNAGGSGSAGWGIPMATDIAFALGVLALLGDRVPAGLKVFLAALAIVDDIGAVLVIALFYTSAVNWVALGIAGALLLVAAGANAVGVRRPSAYALVGLALWGAVLASGVHATIAGVLLAMTIPSRTRIHEDEFLLHARRNVDEFARGCGPGTTVLTNQVQQEALLALETLCEQAQAPLQTAERKLHGIVAFIIMPVFALANAGVRLGGGDFATALSSPVMLGVLLGLVLGKPLGITLFSWAAVRMGVATLPNRVTWRMIHGAAWLGGIGFTMSLFVAGLAFPGMPALLAAAKLGILAASLGAGLCGWILLLRAGRRNGEGETGRMVSYDDRGHLAEPGLPASTRRPGE